MIEKKYRYKKVLLVDDEPAARRKLQKMLPMFCDIEQVFEASDGEEAVSMIVEFQPELVFLDIQMPVMSGIEVALATRLDKYHLVFVTAFEHFAIQAFETHAVDYLLKPVSAKRLQQSLEKVHGLQARIPDAQLQQLAEVLQSKKVSKTIAVKRGDVTVIIDNNHIAYVEAIGGYTRILLTEEGQNKQQIDTLISDVTLESILSQLDDDNFLRVHRSYIVNSRQIKAYFIQARRMFIKLSDFPRLDLPVSRRNSVLIKQRWQSL